MFSKQEASQLRKEFWTVFGQYMKPVPSSEGEKINWINYKTGEKNVVFKINADNKEAVISIELTANDTEIQQLYFEKFTQMKVMFEDIVGEDWQWEPICEAENGKIISRIFKRLTGKSIFKKEDWPDLISFFKPAIISLDKFWSTAKYGFEALH